MNANVAVNTLLVLGAVMIFFSSLQIVGYFARDRAKWSIWGVMVFYWFLYLGGIYLMVITRNGCSGHLYCNLGSIGGLTLVVFGYSAVAFYLLTIYSYTSLVRKVEKINLGDKFIEKIRVQHGRAVIVFFFTTWVASGFVYLIHHRAARIIKKALNNPDMDRKELESELDQVFGKTVDWRKKKNK